MTDPFGWHSFSSIGRFNNVQLQLRLQETVFSGNVTSIKAIIALVVVLKCLPEAWRDDFIWEAWLAVTIQLHKLQEGAEIFPCQWMKQVFYAESQVTPDQVHCVLFGQDPVNCTETIQRMRSATGIAFHAVGNDNASIRNMNVMYHINCDDDAPYVTVKKVNCSST